MNSPAFSPTVAIADSALATIVQEAVQSIDGLETGGVLLGTDTADDIVIRHASGAGPRARRGRDTFLRDLDHAQLIADMAWNADRSQWIGEWHTHPAGGLTPSDVDLNSYLRHLHDPDLGFRCFVALIAGFDAEARIVVAAWIIDQHRARPVILGRHAEAPHGRRKYPSTTSMDTTTSSHTYKRKDAP